jgi:hypothetical protein
MTLATLIQKGGITKVATATPATVATQEAEIGRTVAEVATVAVANPEEASLERHIEDTTPALSETEESAIRTWLAHIEEANPDEIADVLNRCSKDPNAKAYFLLRAQEAPQPDTDNDDRRHCAQCANLTKRGQCLAAKRDEITASSTYYPDDHAPRRCKGYTPGPDDIDRRPGHERWPNLNQTGGNHADE